MKLDRTAGATENRRDFLQAATIAVGAALAGCATGASEANAKSAKQTEASEAEVTPAEDLMQEHGLLERVLLIYDEVARRIDHGEQFEPSVVTNAASIIRRFVEDYHEKNEENFVFPRLKKASREVALVDILLRQHQRGREVTDDIVRRAGAGPSPELARALRNFSRMYRPHAAREDTVLFPAFREVMGRNAYIELGEQLEQQEHQLLGANGFENTVAEVAKLEAALNIADLAAFTAP